MIPADRVVITFTWAPGTRQVGTVEVTELSGETPQPCLIPHGKPRFISEAERGAESLFRHGAGCPNWMQGDPAETPAGVFGDMLLGEGFASWDHTRRALLAFTKVEGCGWARQMLGSYHPDLHDPD